ncbi:MAG: MFS transporter [Betaproteobacteria bacterium]|nr:MAG: MFS transporter [Betaproteobacteria bacterium]
MTETQRHSNLLRALLVVSLILGIAMGTRNAFSGLYLQPISGDMKWGREVFSFTVALQNLVWGASQPFIGYIADRWGAKRVLMIGAALYALGLAGTAFLTSGTTLALTGGIVMGIAVACTTYSVAYSVLGKMVDASRRAWAFGISAAAGSFGQFLMIPVAQWFISHQGWQSSLLVLAVITATMAPLGWYFAKLGATGRLPQPSTVGQASAGEALRTAFGDRSYTLLTLGYFVCGFQVVFIGAHLTPYLLDNGTPAHVGVTALMLVGLFNCIGTYVAGVLAGKMPKRYVLSFIYFMRSVVIVIFLAVPLSAWSVYVFAAAIGVLWLSTVPPTNALIAQIYGARYLGMLGGIVFFSHQIGSFLGAWLGGKLYDATGSYNVVWMICIGLGVFAALVHLPIDERSLESRTPVPA